MTGYDALVIGAGHNGMAAAITMAKAGKSVLLLERADRVGGMAASSELAPGVSGPRLAHLLGGLGRTEIDQLGLKTNGLTLPGTPLPTVSLAADGRHLVIDGGKAEYVDGEAHPDQAAFHALRGRLGKFADILGQLKRKPPPSLYRFNLQETLSFASLALGVRRMGKADAREFMRVLLSNAYDTILDEMTDGPLAGAFGLDAVLGGHIGPRSPGTVLSLMYRLGDGGQKQIPSGGMAGVMTAFEKSAIAAGVEIRCAAAVEEVLITGDRASGVRLADGSEISAPIVLSSLDPMTTVCLTGPTHFDAEMVRRVRNIRAKGCTAKINLALSGRPNFKGLPDHLLGARLVLAPSLAATEKAFNRAKYSELPDQPILEITIPSVLGADRADGAGHYMSIIVQYVPHDLKAGWSEDSNAALRDIVLDQLEGYAPGLKDLVLADEVLSPADIERETGASGGHWHHGEMITDQMLMLRPAPGIERYAMPVGGLFLCGASAHPGGDITAIPGCNAARVALQSEAGRAAA